MFFINIMLFLIREKVYLDKVKEDELMYYILGHKLMILKLHFPFLRIDDGHIQLFFLILLTYAYGAYHILRMIFDDN